MNIKILQVIAVACLCLVFTYARFCSKKAPVQKPLNLSGKPQSYRVSYKIEYYLRKYPAILYDVERISSENRDALLQTEYGKVGFSTCPSNIQLVTKIRYRGHYCHVVRPKDQCIPFATCRTKNCYGCGKSEYKSLCLRDTYRVFKFWVYCKSGFYLVHKPVPQCCRCYFYKLCK